MRTLFSAAFICLRWMPLIQGRIEKDPPRSEVQYGCEDVGESNSGKQKKSIEDSMPYQSGRAQVPNHTIVFDG